MSSSTSSSMMVATHGASASANLTAKDISPWMMNYISVRFRKALNVLNMNGLSALNVTELRDLDHQYAEWCKRAFLEAHHLKRFYNVRWLGSKLNKAERIHGLMPRLTLQGLSQEEVKVLQKVVQKDTQTYQKQQQERQKQQAATTAMIKARAAAAAAAAPKRPPSSSSAAAAQRPTNPYASSSSSSSNKKSKSSSQQQQMPVTASGKPLYASAATVQVANPPVWRPTATTTSTTTPSIPNAFRPPTALPNIANTFRPPTDLTNVFQPPTAGAPKTTATTNHTPTESEIKQRLTSSLRAMGFVDSREIQSGLDHVFKTNTNIQTITADQVMQWLLDQRIENAEARMMDQARLESERMAKAQEAQNKQRQQQELQQAAQSGLSSLLAQFPASWVLQAGLPSSSPTVVQKEDVWKRIWKPLVSNPTHRELLLDILQKEKKSKQWYPGVAKYYYQTLAHKVSRAPSTLLPSILRKEQDNLNKALYSLEAQTTGGGVPILFTKARDDSVQSKTQVVNIDCDDDDDDDEVEIVKVVGPDDRRNAALEQQSKTVTHIIS